MIYRRKDKTGSILVMINSSDKTFIKKIDFNKALLYNNANIDEKSIELKAQSYVLLYE